MSYDRGLGFVKGIKNGMPPEVVKYLPYVMGAAVTFGFYEFQMYRRRQKARRVAEDRQYASSGVYEGRLVELLGICGDMGLSDRQYAYIATRVIGQARRAMLHSVELAKPANVLGIASWTIGPITAIFASISATLPIQFQTPCLVIVSILTGALSIVTALAPYLRHDDKLRESRALAQSLISELCSYIGGTDKLGLEFFGDYADLDPMTTGFTAFVTAIEVIIAKSESTQLSLIPSSTPPDAKEVGPSPEPKTYERAIV